MNKILFAASECVPFVKTGGLADVCGALPKEFDKSYWDVRVVLPNYSCIPEEYRKGVWRSVMYNEPYPLDASRSTYGLHKSRFVYKVAENLNWI